MKKLLSHVCILSFFGIALIFGVSCTHSIHLVHVSDFRPYKPIKKGALIKSSSEQDVVLGFASNTEYVEEALADLEEKCPKGDIVGITTQYSTSHGFFSWTNKILMQGLCVR